MLTCREVTEQTNDLIDGRLGFWPAMKVRMHLLACKHCRAFVRQMRAVVRLIDQYGYTLPPMEPGEDLLDAFRRRPSSAQK